MSLDGYISGPNGESDWILMDPEIDFAALMVQFDTVMMGRRTYELMKQQGGGGGMPGVQVIVISRTLSPADHPGVTIAADPAATIAALQAESGRDIWLFGGGLLLRSLLHLGLVDTVELAVIPVLLGDGTPLLPSPTTLTSLRLVKHRVYTTTGTVSLEYAVQ